MERFSDVEKTVILTSNVQNVKNGAGKGGVVTSDRVFVLSEAEAKKYSSYVSKVIAASKTDFYLRTPSPRGNGEYLWKTVRLIRGELNYHYGGGYIEEVYVAPAMWLDLHAIDVQVNTVLSNSSNISRPSSSDKAESTYKILQQGDMGDDVLTMKKRLQELGYFSAGAELSDQYNSTVAERVKQFQKVNKLKQTGVADEETLKLLFSDKAKKKPK